MRVYVEGGGQTGSGLTACRIGFASLFREIHSEAAAIGVTLDFVAAGGRDQAYDKFRIALRANPERVNLLLVDSEDGLEEPQAGDSFPTWSHLYRRDNWQRPEGCEDNRALLVIRALEAWLLLDKGALTKRYGNRVNFGSIPKKNVVDIDRHELVKILKRVTDKCASRYSKIDAFDILPCMSIQYVEDDPSGKRTVSLLRQHLGLRLKK